MATAVAQVSARACLMLFLYYAENDEASCKQTNDNRAIMHISYEWLKPVIVIARREARRTKNSDFMNAIHITKTGAMMQ